MAIASLIRLTRPANLAIVLVTMMVVRLFVIRPLADSTHMGRHYGLSWLHFIMLCAVALLLTAAGNIINDYFDQKVDRINKPDRVIVGKTVKRRVAIILHQTLNTAALFLAACLCYITGFWWPVVIPVVLSTILWWYSPVLKKKVLTGNIAIALCTSAVPLWAGLFELHMLEREIGDLLYNRDQFFNFAWLVVISLCAIAFLLTLVREAQKDMEDLDGDKAGGYNTLPIIWGIYNTRKYVCGLLILYVLGIGAFIYLLLHLQWFHHYIVACCAALLVIPTALSIVLTWKASTSRQFRQASTCTKWMMLCGLLVFSLLSCFA
ncbi:MAG: geranylgeranylglycerol-phosphate geranylgeranyltransferase [Flavobacteriales bacterium]